MTEGAHPPAESFFPARPTLSTLRASVDDCRACPLYANATQGVFGEGRASARLVLVGEQPGDEEDRTGRPFVGGSGRLLDACLEEAGIDRSAVFVTNVVKHFKFEPRGKRRIHQKPGATEMNACLPWLREELQQVEPDLVVCLGATAAKALIGRSVRVTRDHGRLVAGELAPWMMATYHPSAVLRAPQERRGELRGILVADLETAATVVREGPPS